MDNTNNQNMSNQNSIDEDMMSHSLLLAQKAKSLGEVPVGATVVDQNNKIIGEGWNQPITGHDPTAHAEIMALRSAANAVGNYRLPGSTLYVTIEPCLMCAGAIIHSRVDRIVFGAREPKAGAIVSRSQVFDSDVYNHTIVHSEGILQAECSSLISDFFKGRRAEKKEEKSKKIK